MFRFNLRVAWGEGSKELTELEGLLHIAILDPTESVREEAKRTIRERYAGKVRGGFVEDGKIMVELRRGGESKTAYVCDMPKEYSGQLSEPKSFSTKDL